MNRRISGFIHNEDVVILIHNRKRNRPRQNSVGGFCFDKVRFDHIPGVHGLARPGADEMCIRDSLRADPETAGKRKTGILSERIPGGSFI